MVAIGSRQRIYKAVLLGLRGCYSADFIIISSPVVKFMSYYLERGGGA